ncbi:DNA-binding transcriptional ArsR family regulator [Clostridium pascui]|uniref:helix-turn-helix domain-containing protein n=1 Tax=Clostridium pascui TaxID=46609 RepID=UPI0019582540|nr:helix-turn-helix domain-containing protein [Clostridium pascui]MBM7869263.1 DNA-binding transcriptional ArsR family regulator [Clostridium pascui]
MAKKQWYEHTKTYIKDIFLQKILKANLSGNATKLLLILKGHKSNSGLCNPSQKLLGEEMGGKSIRSIQRYLKELVEAGIIVIQRIGKMITNKYSIVIDNELEEFKQQNKESKEVETKIKNKCNSYKNSYKKMDNWNFESTWAEHNNLAEIEKKLLGWT